MRTQAGVNVLLIETDCLLRNTIASMFELHGHAVSHAHDEMEASALIRKAAYDVLIYNFNPGRMPLSEVVLNAKSIQPHIKLVIANDCELELKHCADCFIDAYIKKPFTLKDLQSMIDAVMQTSAAPISAE